MKISIITACFNNELTISDTITSVLNQTYKNLEYIIIDGASKDNTMSIIEQLTMNAQIDVKVNSEPDKGIYDALNKGIARATGDIIGFLHADDLFYDYMVLQRIAQAFMEHNCDAVYGNLQYVSKDQTDKIIRNWVSNTFVPKNLKRGWMAPHPTLYLKNTVYSEKGKFDLNFHIAADYDFMLRIFSSGISSIHLNYYFVKMRVGGKSNSMGNILNKMQEDFLALRKNKVGGYYALFVKNVSKLPQFFKH